MNQSIESAYVHSIEFSQPSVTRNGKTEQIDLATLRVSIDRSRRLPDDPDGNRRYNNDGNFWINVEVWGPKVVPLASTITKGAAVLIAGRYDNKTWTDKDTRKESSVYVFIAKDIALLPRCIESVTFKPTKTHDERNQ